MMFRSRLYRQLNVVAVLLPALDASRLQAPKEEVSPPLVGGGGRLELPVRQPWLEAVNATFDGQLGFELSHQATQLVGHFGDAVEASVQQGNRSGQRALPRKVHWEQRSRRSQPDQPEPIAQSVVTSENLTLVTDQRSRVTRNVTDVQLGGVDGGHRPRAAGAPAVAGKLRLNLHMDTRTGRL